MIDAFRNGVGWLGICGGALVGGIVVRQGCATLVNGDLTPNKVEGVLRKAMGEIADGLVAVGVGLRAGRLIEPDWPRPKGILVAFFLLGMVVPSAKENTVS